MVSALGCLQTGGRQTYDRLGHLVVVDAAIGKFKRRNG